MTALASKELCDRYGWYLACPECDWEALPASRYTMALEPLWSEDDECDCPNCGVMLGARLTGDDDGDFIVAEVIE